MEFEFDFNISAWIRGLKIEAKSLDEAKEILGRMDLSDIIRDASVKQTDITDLDYKEISATYEVLVKNVHVSPAWWEFDSDEERLEVEAKDFGDFKFTIRVNDKEDLDDLIESELESATEVSGTWTYTKEIIKKY
jgi:hypothetical protein